jgi:hypothetical protein
MNRFEYCHPDNDPCEADIVRSIVETSTRELNRSIKKKEPLTADLMKLLFLKFNTVNCLFLLK